MRLELETTVELENKAQCKDKNEAVWKDNPDSRGGRIISTNTRYKVSLQRVQSSREKQQTGTEVLSSRKAYGYFHCRNRDFTLKVTPVTWQGRVVKKPSAATAILRGFNQEPFGDGVNC